MDLDGNVKYSGRRGSWKMDRKNSIQQENNTDVQLKSFTDIHTMESNTAILAKNVVYSFKKGKKEVTVLNGLFMNVPKGSIYGLTGSSGCGKTTLISCILGIRKIHSGDIVLFGCSQNSPTYEKLPQIRGKDVGYMPQDIALYSKFTVMEMIIFFGRLYEIPRDRLEKAAHGLLSFLELSHKASAVVETLSGGQKRRVSFAISMIHSPKLLVLDEPTVGMDPLLRVKIWDHLRRMVVTKQITVIITTHYVEEMRKADRVGVMVDGRIIVENAPAALLSISHTSTLNDAILEFRKNPKLASGSRPGRRRSSVVDYHNYTDHKKVQRKLFRLSDINVAMTKTLTWKNVKLLLRNIPLLFFLVFMPSLQTFSTLIIGDEPTNINFGVVNEELVNITTCPSLNATLTSIQTCSLNLLGCYFVSLLSPKIVSLVYFESESDAIDSIKTGKTHGYVHFSSNFSDSLMDRALSQHYNGTVEDWTVNNSFIKVQFDRSNPVIYYFLQREFFKSQEAFMSQLFAYCMGNEQLGKYPLNFKRPIFGDAERFNFSEYCSLGVTITIALFYTFLSSGIRLLGEKNSGMYERLIMSGVKFPEMVISHFLSELAVVTAQALLAFMLLVWKVSPVSYDLFTLTFTLYQILFAGYTGILMGFLFGTVLTDPMQLAIIAMAFVVPNVCVSGVVWPVEAMPDFMQYAVPYLPCTLPTESLRWVWNRGLDVTHPSVWPGLTVFPVYSLFTILVTVVVYKT